MKSKAKGISLLVFSDESSWGKSLRSILPPNAIANVSKASKTSTICFSGHFFFVGAAAAAAAMQRRCRKQTHACLVQHQEYVAGNSWSHVAAKESSSVAGRRHGMYIHSSNTAGAALFRHMHRILRVTSAVTRRESWLECFQTHFLGTSSVSLRWDGLRLQRSH